MPEFSFVARDRDGHDQAGVLAADNPSQLAVQLRGRGWIVVDVRGAKTSKAGGLSAGRPRGWLPAKQLDVELGLRQLATMLRSGLTLLSALRTAAEQARRPAMAAIWRQVAERIETGSTFADALVGGPPLGGRAGRGAHGRLFPPIVVQLVHVGEASGTLDVVLKRAAQHLEQSRRVRTMLLTSLMYPAFVLCMAIGVTGFMVFGLIPKLQKFLAGRGRRLPAMSQMLMDMTNWLNAHGVLILASLLILILAGVVLRRIPRGRAFSDRLFLRTPIIGGLLRLAGTATVARAMSILLDSGITLLTALQAIGGLIANRAMRSRVESAREAVIGGGALADSFVAGGSREFMPMLGRMMAVGETTGTLGPVLSEVADFHEEQLAAAIRRFSALIEPITIAVVGGIVGFVYIAFFLALFSVAGGVR